MRRVGIGPQQFEGNYELVTCKTRQTIDAIAF